MRCVSKATNCDHSHSEVRLTITPSNQMGSTSYCFCLHIAKYDHSAPCYCVMRKVFVVCSQLELMGHTTNFTLWCVGSSVLLRWTCNFGDLAHAANSLQIPSWPTPLLVSGAMATTRQKTCLDLHEEEACAQKEVPMVHSSSRLFGSLFVSSPLVNRFGGDVRMMLKHMVKSSK